MTHEPLRIKKNLRTNQWESSVKVIDGDIHEMLEQSVPEWRGFALLPAK
jgi:tRNA G37 N-methylase Trm5